MRLRGLVLLVLAAVAAAGATVSWLNARAATEAAPVIASEPAMPTLTYDPSLIVLALVLAIATGVLVVLGVAGLRRR